MSSANLLSYKWHLSAMPASQRKISPSTCKPTPLRQRGSGLTIYTSRKSSGAHAKRPALGYAIKIYVRGNTFVVWRLDRLARSMRQLYSRLGPNLCQRRLFSVAPRRFRLRELSLASSFLVFLALWQSLNGRSLLRKTSAGIAALQARRKGQTLGAEGVHDTRQDQARGQAAKQRHDRPQGCRKEWAYLPPASMRSGNKLAKANSSASGRTDRKRNRGVRSCIVVAGIHQTTNQQ